MRGRGSNRRNTEPGLVRQRFAPNEATQTFHGTLRVLGVLAGLVADPDATLCLCEFV